MEAKVETWLITFGWCTRKQANGNRMGYKFSKLISSSKAASSKSSTVSPNGTTNLGPDIKKPEPMWNVPDAHHVS